MAAVLPIVEAGRVLSEAEYLPAAVRRAGGLLSSGPGTQTAAAGAGASAGHLAGAAGAGPTGRFVASLLGSAVPGMAPSALYGAKGAISGVRGAGDAMLSNARRAAFEREGVTPSPSQVYQTGALQGAEAVLARNPSSHKIMRDFAEEQAKQLSGAVERAARVLSERSSPMMAGRSIEDGIREPGGFMDRFRETSNALYDALDGFVPADTLASTDNTMQLLDKLTRPTPGAEQTSKLLSNARIIEVRKALSSDLSGKPTTKMIEILGSDGEPISSVSIGGAPPRAGLPYSALKELRTKVGELISDTGITSDIPRRQLRALYGAITQDMKTAVEKTGSGRALKIFDRANRYVRAGHQRIDSVLQPILNRDLPERVYEAAVSGTKKGDSTIHAVMQSLPSESQRVVASTVLRRLGTAVASRQGATGEMFSVSRFLTNWASMSAEARRSLFSRFGPRYVEDLNRLAGIAEDIRNGGEVYANPSGTAPSLILQGTVFGAVMSLFTGHVEIPAATAATQALGYFAARKFADPRFVAWLSKYAYAPVSMLPIALNDLGQSYGKDRQQ